MTLGAHAAAIDKMATRKLSTNGGGFSKRVMDVAISFDEQNVCME
jgi:hypothetical protein